MDHVSGLFVLVSGVVITHLNNQESFASLRWSLSAAKIVWHYYYCILSLNAFPFSFSSAVSCFSGMTVCRSSACVFCR